jgi:hypothetical protein
MAADRSGEPGADVKKEELETFESSAKEGLGFV